LPYPEDEGQEPNLVPTAADGEVADEEIVATVEAAEPAETVVLVSAEEPLLGVAVSATAEAVGGEALWAKPGDLRRRRRKPSAGRRCGRSRAICAGDGSCGRSSGNRRTADWSEPSRRRRPGSSTSWRMPPSYRVGATSSSPVGAWWRCT